MKSPHHKVVRFRCLKDLIPKKPLHRPFFLVAMNYTHSQRKLQATLKETLVPICKQTVNICIHVPNWMHENLAAEAEALNTTITNIATIRLMLLRTRDLSFNAFEGKLLEAIKGDD